MLVLRKALIQCNLLDSLDGLFVPNNLVTDHNTVITVLHFLKYVGPKLNIGGYTNDLVYPFVEIRGQSMSAKRSISFTVILVCVLKLYSRHCRFAACLQTIDNMV